MWGALPKPGWHSGNGHELLEQCHEQVELMDHLARQNDQGLLIAEQVRADRLHLLFRQSVTAVFGSFIAALILCWLCWGRVDHSIIFSWISILGGATLLRIAMFLAYFCSHESERVPHRWERTYWITLIISASIWGGGALALMPKDDLLSQVLILLFTVGMSGSAVSCYSAYRSMTLSAMGLVLLPCTIWLLFQQSAMQVGMALAALLFSASVVRATRELSGALEKAFRLTHEMERAHSIASYAAQTDELTGLKNRRAFFEHAQQLYSYCKRNQRPLCALMLDIDHFKHINDSHGHQVGDEVLRQIGAVIRASFRETDVYGRLGGEEFAVLLVDTPIEAARSIAEKLGQSIAKLQLVLDSELIQGMTASVGVASIGAADNDLHNLLNSADKAMYRAKSLGRNQVVTAE
jgi:diguanylate cyclase (GGDEF)-like protein